MKLMNPKAPVMANWIREMGLRLDARPFISGAFEAKKTLAALSVRKDELRTLTTGYDGGIFNGPHFSRTYVASREHGVPFVGSGDMLSADLSNLPLLRKKEAYSSKLRHLELQPGMTLISCSGTIGRTVYCREEMKGMWSSQHVMKVVPDESKVPPGYLYAFISSKYGIPIVVSGTYGSIIQSIEPQHIATLPVPRFGKKLEQQVHDLVQQAADSRSKASLLVEAGSQMLKKAAGLPLLERPPTAYPFGVSIVSSQCIRNRFDAFFHSPFHAEAVSAIASNGQHVTVSEFVESVIEPVRFKRVRTEDHDHGIAFFGTSAIMNADPEPSYMLVRSNSFVEQCIVRESTVLIPRSGQVSGIIGSAILPFADLLGGAVTEDAIRINCKSETDAGFAFIALNSEYGRRQLKARAFGSSIPHLDVRSVRSVLLPKLSPRSQADIGDLGQQSALLRNEAIAKERAARTIIESAIEGDS